MKQKPACVLNFVLPLSEYDVNVTPDKRETFLKHVRLSSFVSSVSSVSSASLSLCSEACGDAHSHETLTLTD